MVTPLAHIVYSNPYNLLFDLYINRSLPGANLEIFIALGRATPMECVQYHLVMERKNAKIRDENLNKFVHQLIRKVCGRTAGKNVRIDCKAMLVSIHGTRQDLLTSHLSFFFCNNYEGIPCRFVLLESSHINKHDDDC